MNPDRNDTDGKASAELSLRASLLRQELEDVEYRFKAITEHKPDLRQTVAERIATFLQYHAGKTFTPKQLMEAIDGNEAAVRKALAHLIVDGILIKDSWGRYRGFDLATGPTDHDSARHMRNWEDP